jgi:hypothetical protein
MLFWLKLYSIKAFKGHLVTGERKELILFAGIKIMSNDGIGCDSVRSGTQVITFWRDVSLHQKGRRLEQCIRLKYRLPPTRLQDVLTQRLQNLATFKTVIPSNLV